MRPALCCLLALPVLAAGCGGDPPPDEATSRVQAQAVVAQYSALSASGDAAAACRLVSEHHEQEMVALSHRIADAAGTPPAASCEESMASLPQQVRDIEHTARVLGVEIHGDRGTVTTIATATLSTGERRELPPAAIAVVWDGHRWLVD